MDYAVGGQDSSREKARVVERPERINFIRKPLDAKNLQKKKEV